MTCIYCKHTHTYLLGDSQRKCSKCKRKFSVKKILREKKIYSHFEKGDTARQTALETGMHFSTVEKYFHTFRKNIALYADEMYQHNSHRVSEYDEYLYLPASLKVQGNLDKLQHFLTFAYDETIYTVMMPKTKHSLLINEDEKEQKILMKYLKFNTISKLSKSENIITNFWDYFESFICRYKGVSNEKFVYYLKEAEWRFNLQSKIKK